MTRTTLGFLVLMCLSPTCVGGDPYTTGYADCMGRSGGVTVDILDCIGAELETQDARLNGAYRSLGAGLSPARRQQLTDAQRLWIRYRDANCAFYADPDGGTLATVAANECVLRETSERASELEALGADG